MVSDKVKTLSIDDAATKAQETRVVKAESDLRLANDLIETMTNQADAISIERDNLQTEVRRLKEKLERRPVQAKASRKALKKQNKLLERSEERFFLSTHDMLVRRAAEAGLDHTKMLLEGMPDPVSREDGPDQPLVVSSASEAELSD